MKRSSPESSVVGTEPDYARPATARQWRCRKSRWEDTAAESQSHVARTQDTLADAVEDAEVAEIRRAVFRALKRLEQAME